MPHYGAVFGGCKGGGRRQLHQRCWRDGWLLDAALVVVSLLRGDAAAQEIQLAIEYAPNPVFNSGTPESAPHEVLRSFQTKYQPIGTAREAEAISYTAIDHAVW
jgi:hypothetical protein